MKSVTKNVYISPCILLIRHQRQSYTSEVWFTYFLFGSYKCSFVLLIIRRGWKDFMFSNDKFLEFEHPYNLFEYFQNKNIDSNKTLQKRWCTNWSIKEHPFLETGRNKLYSSRLKSNKVPVSEVLESSGFSSYWILPILSCKLCIAYRGRSTIPTSSRFSEYVMTSWHYIVTKSFIIDDVGVWDLLLDCLVYVQSIAKKIKI